MFFRPTEKLIPSLSIGTALNDGVFLGGMHLLLAFFVQTTGASPWEGITGHVINP